MRNFNIKNIKNTMEKQLNNTTSKKEKTSSKKTKHICEKLAMEKCNNVPRGTLYIIKCDDTIIEETYDLNEAKETLQDFNFELPSFMSKAILIKK